MCPSCGKALVREGLELLLGKVDGETAQVEAKLAGITRGFGLGDWKELEELMKSKDVDNHEIDLAWSVNTFTYVTSWKLFASAGRVYYNSWAGPKN